LKKKKENKTGLPDEAPVGSEEEDSKKNAF